MDIELKKGVIVQVDVAQQTSEWLMSTAREIQAAADARGITIAAGSTALEGAAQPDAEAVAGNNDPKASSETSAPERTPLTPETLLATFDTAYQTYSLQIDSANDAREKAKGRIKPAQLEAIGQDTIRKNAEALLAKPAILAELQAEIDYFTENPEAGSPAAGFDLVIVPEGMSADDNEVFAGVLQSKLNVLTGRKYSPDVRPPAIYNDKRTPVVTGKGYRIAFAPHHYNVPRGTASQQAAWMKGNNQLTEAISLQTATDTEALAQINNLVEEDQIPAVSEYDVDRSHRTYFRRFDQAPVGACVSCACVNDYGKLFLGAPSNVRSLIPTRALVVIKT